MYLEYFQLQEHPFNITPDPRYLYYTSHHREALDHLVYGIANRKGFIELTGEVGCGKTTVCRAVLEQLRHKAVSAMIFNPILNGQQLLRAIAADFGVETSRDRLSILDALNRFLLKQAASRRNVVLFIDEAQNLPRATMEQVRLLSNLETAEQKLLQIVLSGQPELKQRLAAPELRQLRQRITVRYHIPPLETADVSGYISHRLKTAGAPDDVGFDDDAVARVAAYSTGIPRMINAVCDYALLAGYTLKTRRINAHCLDLAIRELEDGK